MDAKIDLVHFRFYYREPPGPEPIIEQRFAQLLATGVLAWFFYNFYHHSDMMFVSEIEQSQ